MYTGTMIDDLIAIVEVAEQRATLEAVPVQPEPRMEVFPLWSTYAYEWQVLEQVPIGVA